MVLQSLRGPASKVMSSKDLALLDRLAIEFPNGPQSCPFEKIWGIAKSLLSLSRGFTLILDALDECGDETVSRVGATSFYHHVQSMLQSFGGQLVVFSRPDPRFDEFVRATTHIYLSSDHLLSDILTFTEARYDEYVRLGLPQCESGAVLQRIRTSSRGSFWWTELYLNHLRDAADMTEFEERLHASNNPSIDGFYASSLTTSLHGVNISEKNNLVSILALVLDAQRPISVLELSDALSIFRSKAHLIISQFFKPFFCIHQGLVQFSHLSAREYLDRVRHTSEWPLGYSMLPSHDLAAEICMRTLLKDCFAELKCIALLLRHRHMRHYDFVVDPPPERRADFHHYASKYWHFHLAHTTTPSTNLLFLVRQFLLGFQFAHWCEYSSLSGSSGLMIGVIGPLDQINTWYRELDNDRRVILGREVAGFYVATYQKLIEAYGLMETSSSPLDQALARTSLADYYSALGLVRQQEGLRGLILPTLRQNLEPSHELVLQAEANVAYSHILCGRLRAALKIYTSLVGARRAAMGENDPRFMEALHYQGQSEYLMANLQAAHVTFSQSSTGFLKLRGPDSWSYLACHQWYARTVALLGDTESALAIWQDGFRKRIEYHGVQDAFAITTRIGMADLLRSLGRHSEAIAHLEGALLSRRQAREMTDTSRLDAEIALARTFQEAGMTTEAHTVLDKIDKTGNIALHYQRYCQTTHLKGLVLSAMKHHLDDAIHLLHKILIEVEPDQHNRALLWVRLDLAKLLRRRGVEGDHDLARSLFDNVLKDVSGSCEPCFPDEPDPPRLLRLAEEVLTLLRSREYAEAQAKLEREQVAWARPSELWLWETELIFI